MKNYISEKQFLIVRYVLIALLLIFLFIPIILLTQILGFEVLILFLYYGVALLYSFQSDFVSFIDNLIFKTLLRFKKINPKLALEYCYEIGDYENVLKYTKLLKIDPKTFKDEYYYPVKYSKYITQVKLNCNDHLYLLFRKTTKLFSLIQFLSTSIIIIGIFNYFYYSVFLGLLLLIIGIFIIVFVKVINNFFGFNSLSFKQIRCKYCGHYTSYASRFIGFENDCSSCRRSSPRPSIGLDSWEYRVTLYEDNQAEKGEVYEEWKKDKEEFIEYEKKKTNKKRK